MSTRHQAARAFKTARRTSGDVAISSTSWVNVDTGMDLTLAAAVGDVLQATLAGLSAAEAVVLFLDVATVVAGAPVNSFSNAGPVTASPPKYGIPSWRGDSGLLTPLGGPAHYTVVAGDLVSGYVTLRLRAAAGTAAVKTLFAGANYLLEFAVRNLGPADPN